VLRGGQQVGEVLYRHLQIGWPYTKGLPECHFSGCPMFDQLLITLMKLRLNVPDQDLAYWFGVNQFPGALLSG